MSRNLTCLSCLSYVLLTLGACTVTSDPDGMGSGSESSDTDGDSSTTGEGDGDGDSDSSTEGGTGDTSDQMCELEGGTPLHIQVAQPCASDDPETYEGWFRVIDTADGDIVVGRCLSSDCADCENGVPLSISVEPLALVNLVAPDACLHVAAQRQIPANPDSCEFDTLLISELANGMSTPVLAARSSAEVELPMGLPGFDPPLVFADSCPCEDFPDSCCDGAAPTTFEYDLGQASTVAIGDTALVIVDAREYEFSALDAFQTGECDDPPHLSWALMREQGP